MKEVDVRIRRAANLADYQACVELQKEVWGFTEAEDIAIVPMLMIANRFGGNVLIAQNGAGRAVGFSFALPAWTGERRFWWSHMTAVVQQYRDREVGLQLKISQRENAIAESIDEIRWTFDPLQAVNGHFSVHKLGAVVRTYEENIYGETSSALHRGLPTDRFVAEWRLNSERVRDRLEVSEAAVIMRDLDRISRINTADEEPDLRLTESPLLLETPVNVNEMKAADMPRARNWQGRIRTACLHYFRAGYVITDFFVVDKPRRQAFYLLETGKPL
jgi:predicted GNAT superfamily acetyltransferase